MSSTERGLTCLESLFRIIIVYLLKISDNCMSLLLSFIALGMPLSRV